MSGPDVEESPSATYRCATCRWRAGCAAGPADVHDDRHAASVKTAIHMLLTGITLSSTVNCLTREWVHLGNECPLGQSPITACVTERATIQPTASNPASGSAAACKCSAAARYWPAPGRCAGAAPTARATSRPTGRPGLQP